MKAGTHLATIYFCSESRKKGILKSLISLMLFEILTLLGLGLIKINNVSANFNNPRPSLKFGLSDKHTKFEKIILILWTFTK